MQDGIRNGYRLLVVCLPFPLKSLHESGNPNAVAPDGRIVVSIDSPDSCFESTGIIDPRTGHVEKVQLKFGGVIHDPGWTKDGRIVASALEMRSSLWHFRPEK